MGKKNNIIAFQGVEGAHSDMACRQAYPYMETMAFASFEDAMQAVLDGTTSLCMIPIENSKAGRVAEIHNLLRNTELSIIGECFQRIEHFLVAPKGTKITDITDIYSHPQALMQTKETLAGYNFKKHEYSNTAAAAQDVAKWNDKSKAAISSRLAAELYGLDVILENIEDANDNTTIFIVMSLAPIDVDPNEKTITSVLFTARNIPAALYKALGGFATNNVNLLKIESYIAPGTSNTAEFFISFEGHPDRRNVQLAIEELGFFCRKIKVLGVYPADHKRYE
ncbi:MAG: prephenate dehydratase [Alphaproteobacteria bacterium CG11_big_fil_rev_8_21_14_0_20_39_49]|nr:MAG: prephenate dehydratase [Alphaproteobacteria bacterium CG11_big_fil_rev_8_21_14_0_20_39_49]